MQTGCSTTCGSCARTARPLIRRRTRRMVLSWRQADGRAATVEDEVIVYCAECDDRQFGETD